MAHTYLPLILVLVYPTIIIFSLDGLQHKKYNSQMDSIELKYSKSKAEP